MENQKDNVSKLYQGLIKNGYTQDELGDEAKFRQRMSDIDNRKMFYDYAQSKGDSLIGDYDTYMSKLDEVYNQPTMAQQARSEQSEPYTHVYDANKNLVGGTAYEGEPVVVPYSAERASLKEQVADNNRKFPKMEDLPWAKPQGGVNGHLSTNDLASRLSQTYKEGGMEPFLHSNEDKKVKEQYTPKKEEKAEDVWSNAANKFSLTERGSQLQGELAQIQDEIINKYLTEFKNSDEYKAYAGQKYTSQAELDEANKVINNLFITKYGEAINNDLQLYQQAYNNEMLARYGVEVESGLNKIAKNEAAVNLGKLSTSVNSELESIEKKIQDRTKAVRNENWKPGMSSSRDDQELARLRGERTYLDGAQELIEDSEHILQAAKDEKDGTFVGGALRGASDKLFDVDTWTMGVSDLVGNLRMKNVLEKADKGEKLTKAEEALLDAAVNNMAINAYYRSDLGRGYKAGEVTGESLPFMLEFIINPISSSGNAIAQSLLSYGLKRFGIKTIGKNATKATARFIGDMAAASGMVATTGMPGVLGETVDRMNRDYKYGVDEDGNLNVIKEGDTSFGEALGKSATTRFLENQSEMIFYAFKGASKMMKGVDEIHPGGINGFMDALKNSKVGQLYLRYKNNPRLKEFRDAAKIGGIGEEYLEEVYNNFANVALGEMSYEDAVSLDKNIDTFLGLAPTQVLFSAWGLGSMAYERHKNRKDMERAFGLMSEEQKRKLEELQKMGKLSYNKDIAFFIRETIADQSLTPEQRRAEIEYAYDLAKQNAINDIAEAEVEDQVATENAQIDAATDPQTGLYGEVNLISQDLDGNDIVTPANVFGERVVDGKKHLLVQVEGESERVWVRPTEYDAETYERMPAEEVKAINEEMIRTEAAEQAEMESKYAPEVLKAEMKQDVPFIIGDEHFTPVGIMPEGNGWVVDVREIDENGKVAEKAHDVIELTYDEYRKKLQAQLEAQEAAQAQIAAENAANVDQSEPGSEGVVEGISTQNEGETMPGTEEVATGNNLSPVEEVAQPQAEVQTPVIPTKEDGSIDFVTYGKDNSFKELGNLYGEKMPHKVEVTAKALAEDVIKAQQAVEKAQQALDDAPIGRDSKQKQALEKAQNELAEIQKEADFWNEMDADIKAAQAQRESMLNPKAEVNMSEEPMDASEFVAQHLANGNIALTSESFKKETGYGETERKKFMKIIRKAENGGMTVEQAAEKLVSLDNETGGRFFGNDTQAARDAIIDMLSSAQTWGDIANYVKNNREAMAQKESEGLKEEIEEAIMQNYHTTLEDYVLQNEAAEVENPFMEDRAEEIMAIFAEEADKYEQSLNNAENGQTEGNIAEGSGSVLSEEQSDNTGGIEEQQGTEQVGDGIVAESEAAHPSEQEVSEEEKRRIPLRQRANEWAKALGVQPIFIESLEDAPTASIRADIEAAHKNGQLATGFVSGGKAYFFMPDVMDLSEVDNTYIHEVVAHKGLKEMLGEERFNELCDKVWAMMPQSEKDFFTKEYPIVKDLKGVEQQRAAADEYIAHLAEKQNLTPEEKTIWDEIVKMVRELLDKALDGIIGKAQLTDADISELIKASYANLKSGKTEGGVSEEQKFRFIGRKGAANLDKAEEATTRLDNLNVAREMEAADKDAKTIKMATGWERGADGLWRYEVADNLNFDYYANVDYKKRHPELARFDDLRKKLNSSLLMGTEALTEEEQKEFDALEKEFGGYKEYHRSRKLKDYLDAPELFDAYPELRNVELLFMEMEKETLGKYLPDEKTIVLNSNMKLSGRGFIEQVLVHEIQHAIQHIEGFEQGANKNMQDPNKVAQKAHNREFMQSQLDKHIAERDELLKQKDTLNDKMSAWYDSHEEDAEFDDKMNEYNRQYDEIESQLEIADRKVAWDEKWLDATKKAKTELGEEGYAKVAGEVEARNVTSRMKMSDFDRRNTLASETEDVAREDQIFLKDALENASRFRVSDKGKQIQEEVDKFTSKYASKPVELIDPEMTDEEIEDVVEWQQTAKELKAYIKDSKSMGGYVADIDKILIFVENMKVERMEEAMFHENLHPFVDNGKYDHLLNKLYENGKDDEALARARRFSDREPEAKSPIEFFNYAVSYGQVNGNLEDVLKYFDKEEQAELLNLLKTNGYDYEVEQGRRRRNEVLGGLSRGEEDSERILQHQEGGQESEGRVLSTSESKESAKERAERLKSLFDKVADMGLEGVLGNGHYNKAMMDIYRELPEEARKIVADDALSTEGIDFIKAMDRFLNEKAEPSIWEKVASVIREWLRKAGFNLELAPNEVKYIWWRSQKPLDRNNVIEIAEDAYKKYQLKVGEFTPTESKDAYEGDDNAGVRFRVVKDKAIIEQLEGSKKKIGYRNVVLNDNGTFSSPMAYWLQHPTGGAKTRVEMDKFKLGEWEEAVEHPELVDENGKVTLVKPNKKLVEGVAYDPYIHNRLEPVNLQFKEAWKRNDLVYVETEVAEVDLNSGYKADKSKYPVGVQPWSNGALMLSKYDKPMRILSWEEVANAWVDRLNGEGVEFDVVPPALLNLLVERGIKILSPHKGMGKECNKAYQEFVNNNHDGDGGGTRFRSKKKAEPIDIADERPQIIKEYDDALKTNMFNFQEAFQDRMLSVKVLMDKIVDATGKAVRSFEDVYKAENQLSSKNKEDQKRYEEKFYKPLIDELKELSDKYSHEEVRRYIYCKSGLERNEVLRQRDADEAYEESKAELDDKLAKGNITQAQYNVLLQQADQQRTDTLSKDIDYSGIRGMLVNARVAEVEKEYQEGRIDKQTRDTRINGIKANKQQIIKGWKKFAEDQVHNLEQKASQQELDALWDKINAATNETLRIDFESGMIDRDTYNAEKNMMKYYVPLRNWSNTTAEDMYQYRHDMTPAVSSNQKRAEGRMSEADNPIATIGLMAQNAIVRGNRNKMKQKLYAFVANRETPLASIRNVWYVRDANNQWVPQYADTSNAQSEAEVQQIMDQFEQNMEALAAQGDAFKGKLKFGMGFRANRSQKNEHVVTVMVNGKEYGIYVNGNPRAAQAVNGQTNAEGIDDGFVWVDQLKRLYGGGLTSWNPDFIVPNLVRDTIHASTMTFLDRGVMDSLKYMANIPRIFTQVFAEVSGLGTGNAKLHQYFEEFVNNGGETGYTAIQTLEDYKKEYNKLMDEAKGVKSSIKKGAKIPFEKIAKLLEAANRIAEDVNRFNAFVTAREAGENIVNSVDAAKNITVNFNRKGALHANNTVFGKIASFMSRWILFFNPSVQGIYQFVTKSKVNPKRAAFLGSTIMASGFFAPLINEMLIALMGGDDEDDYWNQSDYKRRNNWMIFTGNGYVSIPLPPVLREIYGMGDIIYGVVTGHIPPQRAVYDIAKQMQNAVGMINVLPEMSEEPEMITTLKGFAPDLVAPIVDIATNSNFMGRPIAKWTDFNESDPEYMRVYKGTSRHWIELSKFINEAGGNEVRRSDWSGDFINPAMMEHLFTSYTGGIGKTINNFVGMITDYVTDNKENIDFFRKAPIVPRFYTPNDERTVVPAINRKYYEFNYQYNNATKALKKAKDGVQSGEHPEWQKYIDEMEKNGETEFIKYFKAEQKRLKKIQDRLKDDPNNKELQQKEIDKKAEIATKSLEILR